jgi:hypothetical protein
MGQARLLLFYLTRRCVVKVTHYVLLVKQVYYVDSEMDAINKVADASVACGADCPTLAAEDEMAAAIENGLALGLKGDKAGNIHLFTIED